MRNMFLHASFGHIRIREETRGICCRENIPNCKGEDIAMKTFNDFGLSEPVIRALNNMGFEEATPIQEQTVPLGLQGKDLIGQAHTGTGKTAAFGIPMVEFFDVESDH